MAQQFLLSIVNPDIKSGDKATIYTDKTGGNNLILTITNNTGFGLTFKDKDLLIKFPKTIVDEAAIKAIQVKAPWTLDGYFTPDTDPDKSDGGAFYVLKLKPPADGVPFPAGSSDPVEVLLADLTPSAKGNASVYTSFDFTDIIGQVMDPSATLSAIGLPKPDDKPLLGDGNALRMTVKVNDAGPTNPLVYTDSKITVTPENAAENRIHINFDFQDQNLPNSGGSGANLGELVPSWDAAKPPTFQIQFPYFGPNSTMPANYDLTDDFQQGDPNYNNFTTARNIKVSLSRTDPSVLSNTFWTIIPPANNSNAPFWRIQPTPQNKHVFTGATQGPYASGLILDLFISHIYANLPIDPQQPETLLYVETFDFPGFADRLTQMPLFKEPSVRIDDFWGEIKFLAGAPTLSLNWQTQDADYCTVTGFPGQFDKNSVGEFNRPIDLMHPLKSSYTLTAVGNGGTSKLQRVLNVQWQESSVSSPQSYEQATTIAAAPDGKTVYVPSKDQLVRLSTNTLVADGTALKLNGSLAKNIVADGMGARLFLATQPDDGGGIITPYDTSFHQIGTKVADPGLNGGATLFPMALSEDGRQLAVNLDSPLSMEGPQIQLYDTNSMEQVAGSPFKTNKDFLIRGIGLAMRGDYIYFPCGANLDADPPVEGGLGVLDRNTMTPVTKKPISIKSSDTTQYYPGPITVSPDGNTVATLAVGYIDGRRGFVLCLIDVPSLTLRKRVQVSTGYLENNWVVGAGLEYTLDGEYLLVFGANYSEGSQAHGITLLSAFDPKNLKELDWSPGPTSAYFGSIARSPDGSRFFVNTLDNAQADTGRVVTLTPFFPARKTA
ncbi:MAG: hypothetical protein AAGP08_00705 [Pseudomonadota bacterium]